MSGRTPSPYRPKDKAVYYFMYRDPQTGRRRKASTGCVTKRAAQVYIDEYMRKLQKSTGITFQEFSLSYFKSFAECPWYRVQSGVGGREITARQLSNKRGHLINYWWRWFGDVPIEDITAPGIREKVAGLSLKLQTKKHILYTGSAVFRDAAFEGLIAGDPCALVRIAGNDSEATDIFEPDELDAFFAADMQPVHRALFSLLRGSGLRLSEALALKWKDVLLESRGVLVLKSAKDRAEEARRTKTDVSRRVAAINTFATHEMQLWYMASPWSEKEDYVFSGRYREHHVTRRHANAVFNSVLARAGIDTSGRNITIRSFRTTFNTVIHDDVESAMRKAQLGHATDRMSDETYYRGAGRRQVEKRLEMLHRYDYVLDQV
jgi:integrase